MKKSNKCKELKKDVDGIKLPKETEFNIDTVDFLVKNVDVDVTKVNAKYSAVHEFGAEMGRTTNRIQVTGRQKRHHLSIRYGLDSKTLSVQGSPYAYLGGQNVYTSSDLPTILFQNLKKLKKKIGIESLNDEWDIDLKRVDVAVNFRFSSEAQVLRVLKQLGRQLIEKRGSVRKVETSVYYSPKSGKRYEIAMYAKGPQMRLKDNKDISIKTVAYSDLIDDCSSILRIEVRLRRAELKTMGLDRLEEWKADTARDVFEKYFKRLKILNVLTTRIEEDTMVSIPKKLRPVVALLKSGCDLKAVYPDRAIARYKSDFKKLGIDVTTPWREEKALRLLDLLESKKRLTAVPKWLKSQREKRKVRISI